VLQGEPATPVLAELPTLRAACVQTLSPLSSPRTVCVLRDVHSAKSFPLFLVKLKGIASVRGLLFPLPLSV